MKRIHQLEFSVNTHIVGRRDVMLELMITNNAVDDYSISRRVLYEKGYSADMLIHIQGPTELYCRLPFEAGKQVGFREIRAGEAATNIVRLLDVCPELSTVNAGIYTVRFNGYYPVYCKDDVSSMFVKGYRPSAFAWMVANTSFIIHDELNTSSQLPGSIDWDDI